MGTQPSVPVDGVWLRRIGDQLHVLVETGGEWRLAISEQWDGNISHIVEPSGILASPVDVA